MHSRADMVLVIAFVSTGLGCVLYAAWSKNLLVGLVGIISIGLALYFASRKRGGPSPPDNDR